MKTAPPPRVSIVIPMFNVEKFIKTCLDSILSQTFQDFEVIVIDDCSTDRSAEIVASYNDPRIKLFRQFKNFGESVSRNLGISLSQGKYIYIMDDDDALMPNTIATLVNSSEESQAEVVIMNSYFETHDEEFQFPSKIKINKRLTINPTPRFLSTNLVECLQNDFQVMGVSVVPWMRMQRRDFLLENQIYFPNIARCGDIMFHFAEMCFAQKFQVIDACRYIYRMRHGNTTNSPVEKRLRQSIESIPVAMKFMSEVFESPAMQNFPRQLRVILENGLIAQHFAYITSPIYSSELSLDRIDMIVEDIVHNSNILDLNFIRVLIQSLMLQIVEKNHKTAIVNQLQKTIQQLKGK